MINKFQQPCQADWSDEQKKQDRTILRPLAVLAGVVIGVGAMTYGCQDSAYKTAILKQREAQAATPPLTSEQEEYRKFFARHGSPAPVEMAKAVTAAKPHNRPVLAAVAVVESNGNPKAVGDGGASKGSMQVQPKHHGPVPTDARGQVLQAERILTELVDSEPRRANRWKHALAQYNGGPSYPRISRTYATRVIALAKQVPRP